MDNDGLTQYMRIAISVAERIAAGELRELIEEKEALNRRMGELC